MAPNMANNTQSHGYMENECLILEWDKKSPMNGHITLIPSDQDAE
jgi:hypothetical protein